MNTLHITVGLPRSGKSTWAKRQNYPIVNPDSIRLALHGQVFIRESEPMVWTITRYMIQSLFIAGHTDVILDATNIKKSDRDKWISKDWFRAFYIFSEEVDICIKRALNDNNHELAEVIRRMGELNDSVAILDEIQENESISYVNKDIIDSWFSSDI